MIARVTCLLSALASLNIATLALGGDLNPPAAPSPTPGPEPRIAINDVNTPGDASAEFMITASGSYYLEDNLIVLGNETKHGIVIEVSDVTLDLNGFTLDGYTFTGAPHMNLSLTGILASGDLENITVQNGVVRDWGEQGVALWNARNTLVDQIIVSGNGEEGMWTGVNGVVTRCVAEGNADDGILAGIGSTVSDCSAWENGSEGIFLNGQSTARGCASSANGGTGIGTANRCSVIDCIATDNTDKGIAVGSYSTVRGCTVHNNAGSGISGSGQSLIIGNSCTSNGDGDDAGILILNFPTSVGSRIEGNNVALNDNAGISVNHSGNLIIRNSASENGTNYSIVGGNTVGPTVTSAGINVSPNPHANYSF